MALPTAMLSRTIGKGVKWVAPLRLVANHNSDRLAMVEVLATASSGLHYTRACEDGGRARRRGHTVILAPTTS